MDIFRLDREPLAVVERALLKKPPLNKVQVEISQKQAS